jgi:hypothetical protein
MAKLEDEFKDLSVVPGKTLILRVSDAIAFVLRCREKQVKVLGIDGFRLPAGAVQPDLNESIDLSTPENQDKDCWKLAEEFLIARPGGLFFDVVADE